MKTRILIPGKKKDDFYNTGINYYLSLLQHYQKIEIEYVNETSYLKKPSQSEINKNLDIEANNILKKINDKEYLILIDIHGKDFDTISLVNKIDDILIHNSNLVFVFGSSYGISDLLRSRANLSISLSKLTFTHYESLLILLEQLYRYNKIKNNEEYDK